MPNATSIQRIMIAGAAGLVGQALAARWWAQGKTVVELAHRPRAGAFLWNPQTGEIPRDAWAGVGAVVNLAGESIAQRWTKEAKKRIEESRINATAFLSKTMAALPVGERPKVFLCASAIGYYGAHCPKRTAEGAPKGDGFLADLCEAWENATLPARQAGIRTVNARLGVVLAKQGGAIAKMLPIFRLGLGGPVGSGRQRVSWMALSDVVAALLFLLREEESSGAINVVAPTSCMNRELSAALGRVLHRPAILPAPEFAMKWLFGEMAAETILADQNIEPQCLRDAGFQWQYPEVEAALRHELADWKGAGP